MKTLRTSTFCFFHPLAFGVSSFFLALLLSAFQPFSLSAFSQNAPTLVTITGRVSDAEANIYLANAEVRVAGSNVMAYTNDDGSFSIDVPVGPVTLTASYSNTQPGTQTIDARPGVRNVVDFDLKPILTERRPPTIATDTPATGESIVMLERFIVTEERVGQARALSVQRAADNAVIAMSIDNFGDLTSGSIGEFLKYMPGVTIDYGEDEAETARVGGLDPKYAGFAIDGISLASGFETSRANSFSQMSVTGIESIEFSQTLLAHMPANTPQGKFDLKTKYAFNRKKPELRFQVGLDGNSNAIELGRDYLPDDKKHWRTYLGGQLGYGGIFLNRRLGVEASISRYSNYRNNQSHTITYSYRNPDPVLNPGINFVRRNGNLEMDEGPVIQSLVWRDGPKLWTQEAASLNIDYKVTPRLIFSLRNNFVVTTNEYYNSYYQLRAMSPYVRNDNYTGPTTSVNPESTLTKWIVDPISPVGILGRHSTFINRSQFRQTKDTNYLISPRLEYKNGALQIDFRGAHSYSRREYKDGDAGFFRSVSNRIQGVGWIAERSSTSSPEWYITQTAGTDWSQPQNYDRADTYLNGTSSQPGKSENIQTSGFLDFTYAIPVLSHPVTFRGGLGYVYSEYYYKLEDNRYVYIGPEGRQRGATIPTTENYFLNLDMGGKAGNINNQGWRVNNLYALWDEYVAYPDRFLPAETDNARRNFMNVRDLDESISAAYVEATTRAGKFSFNAGLRVENTRTKIMTARMRPWEEIDAARAAASPEVVATGIYDYTTNEENVSNMDTVEGFFYQYYDGKRFPRIKNYTNFFFSGGLKYDITKNLRFQLSASQAILRPDYDNLAGTMSYSVYHRTNIWVPNPNLDPEKTLKVLANLTYYFKPAGYVGISVYRLDINGLQLNNKIISREQAEAQVGYPIQTGTIISGGGDDGGDGGDGGDEDDDGDDDESDIYDPRLVVFRSTINAPGTRIIYGMTIEYNQQLTFLPGALKGLSVFGSFTCTSMKNAQEDEEKIGQAKTSANGGIRYRYKRLNIQLRATWTDDRLVAVDQPISTRRWFQNDHCYEKARTIVDLSGGFRITKNLTLAFSVRNITNSPSIQYSNIESRLTRYQVYGSIWNLSMKGTF